MFDPRADRFLVNIKNPAMVAVVNAEKARVEETWPIEAAGPHGIDIDHDSGRAFIACDGAVVVAVELGSGKELGRTPIAGEPDAVWFNPAASRLYVAIGNPGLLQVVDTNSMRVAETLNTERGAKTTAFDPRRQTLYVFQPASCKAVAYDEL